MYTGIKMMIGVSATVIGGARGIIATGTENSGSLGRDQESRCPAKTLATH
jgi:hypothetical protein